MVASEIENQIMYQHSYWNNFPYLILSSERVVRLEDSCWMSDSSTGWLRGQGCWPNTCWESMVSHTYRTKFRSVADRAWRNGGEEAFHSYKQFLSNSNLNSSLCARHLEENISICSGLTKERSVHWLRSKKDTNVCEDAMLSYLLFKSQCYSE